MIVEDLNGELVKHLPYAQEVYFAIALAQEEPLDRFFSLIPTEATQKVLVGVDLPTSIEALELLKDKQDESDCVSAAIFYNRQKNFHPKVYLIKKKDNWMAFIGSANLTNAGLSNNVELSYLINDNEHCQQILEWFNSLFKDSFPIDEYNINVYGQQPDTPNAGKGQSKKHLDFKRPIQTPFDHIDFSDRFFKKEHHWAFRREMWSDSSGKANKERFETQKKFEELHDIIFPKFESYGIGELEHNVMNHLVSMSYHLEGATTQDLSAMWLSYGKKRDEIKEYHDLFPSVNKYNKSQEDDKQSFINHARLQIRLELESIGVWLLFGKNNGGSQFDRDHFFREMKRESYREDFHKLVINLPNEYWIDVNEKKLPCNSFDFPDDLYDHCKRDDPQKYFSIGRDYEIADPEMSEIRLPITTLEVFNLLYPLYDMMRHKL